jgi:hypothetical protein
MLKNPQNRLLTRAVRNRAHVIAAAYRAATGGSGCRKPFFSILFSLEGESANRSRIELADERRLVKFHGLHGNVQRPGNLLMASTLEPTAALPLPCSEAEDLASGVCLQHPLHFDR